MFELLMDIFAYCWKLLDAELPDCVLILNEVRAGRRSIAPASKGYLWLCHMTAVASVVRAMALVWFFVAVIDLIAHFRLSWPPFDFKDSHHLWWGFSFTDPAPSISPVHFCLPVAIVAMTTFVATALSYYGVARLSTQLVGMLLPPAELMDEAAQSARRSEVA